MKKQAKSAIVLGIVGLLFAVYGLTSHGWYNEEREHDLDDEEGFLRSHIGYGIRGVSNLTLHRFNGTTLDEEEKVQDYDDFIGVEGTRAAEAGSTMFLIMIAAIALAGLFIPLVYLSSEQNLDESMGRLGPYFPLIVAQIAAILLIVGPIWFSHALTTGLDEDMNEITGEPSQALGGMTGFWVIMGGLLVQVGAIMALSRTRLTYIEPL
jgi:hypothetical protein